MRRSQRTHESGRVPEAGKQPDVRRVTLGRTVARIEEIMVLELIEAVELQAAWTAEPLAHRPISRVQIVGACFIMDSAD